MKKNPGILIVEDPACHLLEMMKGFRKEFEAEQSSYPEALKRLDETRPDAVVLNLSEHKPEAKKILENFQGRLPRTRWTLSAPAMEPEELVDFMRLGASDFLKQPLSEADFQNFLVRFKHWEETGKYLQGEEPHRIVSVFSCKGGVGVTLCAVNAALALHRQKKQEVLLGDFVLQHGNAGHFLDLAQGYSVFDLMENLDRMDAKLLAKSVEKHKSGLSVLACPRNPEESEVVFSRDPGKMIDLLKETFPWVVFDAGHELNTTTLACLDCSDLIFLVTTPDLPSVCNTRAALTMFQKLGYPEEKVKLVLNRWKMKGEIKSDVIEKNLKQPLFHQFPEDATLALTSINQGVPLADLDKSSEIAKSFERFAEKIVMPVVKGK